jgi:SWIM zinc finger
MARWTVEQVLAAAPDDSSRSSAKGLVNPKKWTELGSTEALVWGKCQGSGKTPYQVSVDLNGPAFRCTCPSRKFPCKHGVALLLMWAANDGSVEDSGEASAFADEWAKERQAKDDARTEKAEKKAEKIAAGEDVVDPVARAKREAQRVANITAGLDDLDRWIGDLIRQGLASARAQPYSFWDQVAARLVDSQAPGIAERIRVLGSDVYTRADWVEHLLIELGVLASIVRAWRNRDSLDEVANADLRTLLGWSRSSDEVRALGIEKGQWFVMARRQTQGERVSMQRTWLWSTSANEWVMVLDFAVGSGAWPITHSVGTETTAEVARYPGSRPHRVLLASSEESGRFHTIDAATTIDEALDVASQSFATNPWISHVPMALQKVRTIIENDRVYIINDEQRRLPVVPGFVPWTLLAQVGHEPTSLVGEWDGVIFHPLTAQTPTGLVNL